jgi:hypothetical protein
MKLYDFSLYAKRRDERKAAEAVASAVASLNHPGAVNELKTKVEDWFDLHREVVRRAAS